MWGNVERALNPCRKVPNSTETGFTRCKWFNLNYIPSRLLELHLILV